MLLASSPEARKGARLAIRTVLIKNRCMVSALLLVSDQRFAVNFGKLEVPTLNLTVSSLSSLEHLLRESS